MLILACDTSGAACSVCLLEDDFVRADAFLSVGQTHSRTFMPLLDEMIAKSGYTYAQIDCFASTVGPGSFTGIRIGVSALKVMAMVEKKPAVPVSSLQALAFPFFSQEDTLVLPMIDARNRRVFSGAYWNGKEVIREIAGSVETLWEDCRAFLKDKDISRLLLCGNAAPDYLQEARDFGFPVRLPSFGGRDILASSVAFLARKKILAAGDCPARWDDAFPATLLSPEYLAITSAERMKAQRTRTEDE